MQTVTVTVQLLHGYSQLMLPNHYIKTVIMYLGMPARRFAMVGKNQALSTLPG
jgi:hypothetical protein